MKDVSINVVKSTFKKKVLYLHFVLFFLTFSKTYGQKTETTFRRPLDIPVSLSGGFAELRDNHFHSGIDFRTQSTVGHKIFACEQGYVSRISVSATGYGKALYISHPNGYTTVYAHLDAFNGDIAKYVKQQQYELERFAVNLFPDSNLLRVKRGEIVAFSGNTGGSSGPHLHFEVRDTKTQDPVNPLQFGFGVTDNVPPVIQRLAVYPIGKGSTVNGEENKLILDLEKIGNTYRIPKDVKIKIVGKVTFGINTYDNISGSTFRCGPYSIKLWVDSDLMFSQTMDRFSFDETRYINSLIDYEHYINNRVRFNRLYIEPNNKLSVYDNHIDRGIVSFPDSAIHKALIVVSDFHGNSSRLNFDFEYSPGAKVWTNILDTFMLSFSHKKDIIHTQQGIRVVIPHDALYDETDITITASSNIPRGLYSRTYNVHNPSTPLHVAMNIDIDAENVPERLREKALVVQIAPNGRRSNVGGAYKDGVVSATSRVFGEFAIGVDTIPPRITPVNIKAGANMRGNKNIRFKITDDFSGIGTYNGWINGQWVLFEYDAKNALIFYDFDAEHLKNNTTHTLELKVSDSKGNMAEYKTTFMW